MTHIEQMIQDMCPNGVEFKTLGEVLDYEQPTPYIVKNTDYDESYSTPVLTAGQSFILGYTNEKEGIYKASKEQPTIIFDDFTTSFHWVDFDFKVKSSAMKMLRPKNDANINFRFVFYAMQCIKFQATEHTRYWISKYSQFEIPLPPLEIQKKIVECLDKFSALAAELQAELQLRRKQYEYYRTHLLTPHSDCNSATKPDDAQWECQRYTKGIAKVYDWQWKTLGEVCKIGTGSHNTQDGLIEGDFPFYTRGTEILRLNSYDFDEAAIITAGDGAGVGKVFHYVQGKYALHQRAYRIIADRDHLLPRFLYHYMRYSFYDYIMKTSVSSSVTSVRKPMLEAYPIPLPSLEEQARIVAILDKFEKLITSMEEGIPAEQAAQQKRYEYYRDLLLTFDRKAV